MKTLWSCLAVCGLMMLWPGLAEAQGPFNRTEAEGCRNCHSGPNPEMQEFVVDGWYRSSHGATYQNRVANTYCSRCHSPLQADPAATRSSSAPVNRPDWQHVTCSACHPPHGVRAQFGTPIGNYNVDLVGQPLPAPWQPVYHGDENELCEHCHRGRHSEQEFHGFGHTMFEKKGVRCIDCHMPEMPLEWQTDAGTTEIRMTRTHNMNGVLSNLPYSCGTEGTGCHANKTNDWAAKKLAGPIHQEK